MFRDAFKAIAASSGEWLLRVAQEADGKQPYFISAADGSVLSFAGLWDR